ncbi:MAG: ATP-binding cassette domain-containing protein [Candidatus Nezhaarchaeales archaeon]
MELIRVELKDVYVTYKDPNRSALSGISLSISDPGLVLITGPNGSGKTTLLETCLGLLKPFKGTARLLGVPTTSSKIREVRKLCGYLPQNFMRPPYEAHTVRQVIALGLASINGPLKPLTVKEWDKVRYVSKLLEIEHLLEEPIGRLSGGQQQRVFLARALVRDPLILFLDEPFSNIDSEGRGQVLDVLHNYVESRKATIMVVSHFVDPKLKGLATLTVTLIDGRVVSLTSRC